MHKTLAQWLAYIETLNPKTIDLGLERVLPLARHLKLTTFPVPVIAVTGTNGKGSCVALLDSIYRAAGFRTGTYTSPHLLRYNERICLQGQPISDADLINCLQVIEKNRGNIQLSFFEFTTLAALYYFKQQGIEVLILEVGLGGRLDAVNMVENDVAIITSIALDHCDYLGVTRQAIAAEKAGLMCVGKTVICGELDPPTNIAAMAQKLKTTLYQLQHDFNFDIPSPRDLIAGSSKRLFGVDPAIKLRGDGALFDLPNCYWTNVACSLMAVLALQDKLPVGDAIIQQ
nr:bifunctional folylpolyglutamate synthase/dihydrofolate synthase [Gammaproteobacteria bacterium]